jgi:hypothetical protein
MCRERTYNLHVCTLYNFSVFPLLIEMSFGVGVITIVSGSVMIMVGSLLLQHVAAGKRECACTSYNEALEDPPSSLRLRGNC